MALLTDRYSLNKRLAQAAFPDLLGLLICIDMVGKAEPRAAVPPANPVAEVVLAIASVPALNVDETDWRQVKRRAWPWTVVSAGMTLFRIDESHGTDALRQFVGVTITPVITSDRFATQKRVRYY